MRWSLTTSILLHAAILAAALVVLPNPDAFNVTPEDPIPVDIVSIEDFSKRQATAKVAEPPKPEEKVAPKKQEVVKDVKPAPEVAPEIKTAAKEPKAEPPPEPKKEEPKKEEPKPEEAKPLDPDPLKELIKDTAEETPEPKKEEPKKEEPKKAEVKPKVKPKPEKKKPEKKLDMNEIEAFLNKEDDVKTAPQKPTTEEGSPIQGEFNMAGADNAISATIVDALTKRFSECWNIPPGARELKLLVKVHFQLNSDGSVLGTPEVTNSSSDPLFPSTAQSALSAVQSCGPYDFLPQDRYDLWQDNTFGFSPDMMSGT